MNKRNIFFEFYISESVGFNSVVLLTAYGPVLDYDVVSIHFLPAE